MSQRCAECGGLLGPFGACSRFGCDPLPIVTEAPVVTAELISVGQFRVTRAELEAHAEEAEKFGQLLHERLFELAQAAAGAMSFIGWTGGAERWSRGISEHDARGTLQECLDKAGRDVFLPPDTEAERRARIELVTRMRIR